MDNPNPSEASSAGQASLESEGAQSAGPDTLLILPVRDTVLFPGVLFPISIGRPVSIAAVQQAMREERQIGILMQRDGEAMEPYGTDMHRVGTVANIARYLTAPDGGHHVIVQGIERFRVLDFVHERPVLEAKIQRIAEPGAEAETQEIEARTMLLRQQAIETLELLPQVPAELVAAMQNAPSGAALADLTAAYMDISSADKQEILETADPNVRMDKVSRLLSQRIEVLRLSQEIGRQTKAVFDERQREAVLREQMAAIQRQLGEGDGKAEEIAELNEAIAKAQMPKEVEAQARKELRRYERMPEQAAEAGMIRTYLDTLVELPWALPEEKPIDIAEARRVLEADHFGLEKIKQRIVEYLAVRKLAPQGKAPILCFVGPPGVGKTSLGQSIARAMQRPFTRVSLGGVHDEAEIRGHRRTYIGALPGNIIQGIKKAGARNCVMMLDEIDKMGRGFQGDPSAAMLEVLDPEQNSTFRDAYLAVPFDLSRVTFITTANQLETIPGPLQDRMEIVWLAGYTGAEKLQIARRYLVKRQLEANGLTADQASIDDEALSEIIHSYTREAGVRSLEREIGRVFRHVAVRIAETPEAEVRVTAASLVEILGQPRFENEAAMRTAVPGVATGLAWTPVGGDILFIEATRAPGKGSLILTGQLGDVMRESAQAALSLIKNRAASLGIDTAVFEKSDIHIHVPAGATPKDGPSAGVAMFTALYSLLSGRTVRSDTAMTGEISLRGLVLPVGGIKEKVTAAARAGLKRVLLPARNRRDYDEIPEDTRKSLEFVWLEDVDGVTSAAFEPAGKTQAAPEPVS
ncbi:MAG: endopeptidase La [Rhodomicrobium sp.]